MSIKSSIVRSRGWIFFGSGFFCMLAIGWIVFPLVLYKTEPQPFNFSHKIHAGEQLGMACEDCHKIASDGRFLALPPISKCAECHASQIGQNPNEKILVDKYIVSNREIPWHGYMRQPDNAYFSHASHVIVGKMKCEDCHGRIGSSDSLRTYSVNRISGYSRDIWGLNIPGFRAHPWEGMNMDRCIHCHAERGRRDGCIQCHK